MNADAPEEEIAAVRRDLAALDVERRRLVDRLDQLRTAERKPTTSEPVTPIVTNASSAAEKVALFRRLFGSRTDVFQRGGTIRNRGSPDTRPPAPMNGSKVSVASRK
jgi:hypothetical protein